MGIPKLVGLVHGKSLSKWMRTGASPMTQETTKYVHGKMVKWEYVQNM